MSLRWPLIASEATGDDICERLFFYLKGRFSDTASCSRSVSNFKQSGRRRPYIHGDLLRSHRTLRRRRSQKAYESSQGTSDTLKCIVGHLRLCLGCPQWVKNLASNRTILVSKIGTATGVAMPKKFATSRRRPESASAGCKFVRSVSAFNPSPTHRK